MEEAGHEKRFASLLQPIKDLAATWNIDIAAELEQYLEELEQIEVTVESAGKFNFVEAALVVQGSTHVYSRKVELLHQLVYRALEHVVAKKESTTRVKQVQSIEDHTHLLALKVPAGKDLEQGGVDSAAVAPCLRRMPLFLMPREKTDRKRISHKIGGCAFLKSAVLLEESDALQAMPEGDDGPDSPLVPAPPMGPDTAKKKARQELKELAALEAAEAMPEAPMPEPPAPPPPADDLPDLPDFREEDFEEPWVQMDPHENLGAGKPLKEGKTVAKPPARLLRPLSEITLTDPFGDTDLYEVGALRGTLRRLGLDDLADCEFLVVAELRRRRRAALEQARLSKGDKNAPKDPILPDLEFDADDGGGMGPAGAPADIEPVTPGKPPSGIAPFESTPGSANKALVDEIQKKLEAAQVSYEAVVQQRLKELDLFAGAHAGGLACVYANVRKWQDGLEPILAEQDERVPFDIHKYGAFLLDKIAEAKDQKIEFFRIVDGMPHWEVFRYFLAALVLTNNGNVDILNSAEKSFGLSLLEGERPYALEDNEMTGFKDGKESKENQENMAPANEPAPKRAKKSEGAARKAEMKAAPAPEEMKAEPAPAEAAPAKRRRKAA